MTDAEVDEQLREAIIQVHQHQDSEVAMTECEHPECTKETFGGSINGAAVCMNHIEWAMGKAFAPIRKLEEILREDAPVESEVCRRVDGLPCPLGCGTVCKYFRVHVEILKNE